jgi:hypothetical protein
MIFDRLTIQIERGPSGYLQAHVVQTDSRGPQFGENLLKRRWIKNFEDAATVIIQNHQGTLARHIDFKIVGDS